MANKPSSATDVDVREARTVMPGEDSAAALDAPRCKAFINTHGLWWFAFMLDRLRCRRTGSREGFCWQHYGRMPAQIFVFPSAEGDYALVHAHD